MNTYCSGMDEPIKDDSEMVLEFDTDIRPIVGGGSDYGTLNNKPSINGVTLIGNKTNEELNIRGISNTEIESLLKNFM